MGIVEAEPRNSARCQDVQVFSVAVGGERGGFLEDEMKERGAGGRGGKERIGVWKHEGMERECED